MAIIGPEVSESQIDGAKANVGFMPALMRALGGVVNKNNNAPTIPEGPKAPLTPASQVTTENLVRGWKDPGRTVLPQQATRGYNPQWKFVPPPGYGDAPQHIYDAYSLIPLEYKGTGSNPVDFLRSLQVPMVQNFAMRQNGYGITGGNILLTGLYTPDPIATPNNP